MSTYAFLKIATLLALPPGSLAVGVVLWLALMLAGWRRLARLALGLAVLQTLVLSFPLVAGALIETLEAKARRLVTAQPSCCYDAIVVLGGAIAPAAPPLVMDPDLNEAADRVWQAARFYHAGIAPTIIASGGSDNNLDGGPSTSEAEAMRRFLVDLGVPDKAIVLEDKSLNTIQNLANVRDLVKGGRILIITSAFHVPRVAKYAELAGLNAAYSGVDWSPPADLRPLWENWIPDPGSMAWSCRALRELLALVFDRRAEKLAL